jgi:hypothetical protein
VIVANCFVTGCQKEDAINELDSSEFETYLSLGKSDFDFARDWEDLSEDNKNIFLLAKKRMNIIFEKNGICKTKWTSGSQVNMSDELFEHFIKSIDFTNEVTKELSQMQRIKPPRLKSGNESARSNNCVVQSLFYVLQSFGSPYTLEDVDSYIYNFSNYYQYDTQYGWGANTEVLNTFLHGEFIDKSNLTHAGSSQYILILSGSPLHAVVFTGYSNFQGHYYDPQNNASGSCSLSEILQVYMATSYFYLW